MKIINLYNYMFQCLLVHIPIFLLGPVHVSYDVTIALPRPLTCWYSDREDGRESDPAAVPQHHAGAGRQDGGEEEGRRPGTRKVAASITMRLSFR